jgi:hypothetical protein
MADLMQKITPPAWMLGMFKAIDTLDVSPTGGFAAFADDLHMNFYGENVQGKENVKAFFVRLDSPLITEHFVDGVWQTGDAYVVQGHATGRKKSDPVEKTMQADLFFNLIWVNKAGKVVEYIVSLPPELKKELGMGN